MTDQNTTSLKVEGMTCSHCVGHVEKALAAVPGVSSVTVDLATKSAQVSHNGTVDGAVLAKTSTDAGYPAVTG